MTITQIKIRRIFPEGALRAIVSVTFDDCLAVHDIKVIEGSERLFAAMPSHKDDKGVYRDIVHPSCTELRNRLEGEILAAYEKAVVLETLDT